MSESYTVTSKKNHVCTSSRSQGVRLTKEQTQEAQDKFLKAFASNGNVRAACMSAGIDRQTVYPVKSREE